MTNRTNATQQGVTDAWDHWLHHHPVTVTDLIEDAVRKEVAAWLKAHSPELIDAIAAQAPRKRP